VDSHVALVDAGGTVSHRRPLRPLGVAGRVGVSRHRVHWLVGGLPRDGGWPPVEPPFRAGPWMTTASVLRGAVEVRLARIDPDSPSEVPGPWTLRVGGYALAGDDPPAVTIGDGRAVAVRADGLTSAVVGLAGLSDPAVVERVGVNAYGRYSAVPVVTSGGPVEPGRVYAAAVVLGGPGGELDALAPLARAPGPSDAPPSLVAPVASLPALLSPDDAGPGAGVAAYAATLPEVVVGAEVTVRWPDGETDRVRLDPTDG
jgi:hypothetical protein